MHDDYQNPIFISRVYRGVINTVSPQAAVYQSIPNEDGPRNNWFYSSGAIAYRSGKYKIHLSSKDRSSNPDTREREPIKQHEPPLLFDLSKDLGEQHNINAEHPEVVDRLLQELKRIVPGVWKNNGLS